MKNIFLNLFVALYSALTFSSCGSDDTVTEKMEMVTVEESGYTQYGSPFVAMPEREDVVIYQVNLRAFSEAGNLAGVRERLGQIKSLGANVVYLMPIYPVGVLNSVGALGSPYSVKDYKSISAEFGNLEDLRAVVDEAHAMGLAVILDWVANHTSWDNAWITEHPNWYQSDGSGNIIAPPGTGWNDVAQLDYSNMELRAAMIDAMSFWVYHANIDGFRCDFADGLPQGFWSTAIQEIRNIKDQRMLLFAEGTRKDHYAAGFDYTFGFRYFDALKNVFLEGAPATELQVANAEEYSGIVNNEDKVVRYTSNHDVNIVDGTPLQLFGGKPGSLAIFTVAAYMRSIPMIYNGQEIGWDRQIAFFDKNPIDWNTADAEVLAEYRKIIDFRNRSEAIKSGTYTGFSSSSVSAFTMTSEDESVLVISNLSNTATNYILPASLSGQSWKDAFTEQSTTLNGELNLAPYQYVVLKN